MIHVTNTKYSVLYRCDICGWQRGSRGGQEHWEVCPECEKQAGTIQED